MQDLVDKLNAAVLDDQVQGSTEIKLIKNGNPLFLHAIDPDFTGNGGATGLQQNTGPNYKYHEPELIAEFSKYVESTYNQHYVGEDNIQSLDLIFAVGHGPGFCSGNILKLAARKDKKGQGHSDLLKIMHYAMLLLHLELKEKEKNAAAGIQDQAQV